jgi:2-iminobutanoate/2-iminopropanoate deaminase
MRILLTFLSISMLACQNQTDKQGFEKVSLHAKNGYSQSYSIINGNTKTIYLSGQVGAGKNLTEQMQNAIQNINSELKAANAELKDLVKMNWYIVNYKETFLDTFRMIRKSYFKDSIVPASTLIGVSALAKKEWLIEVEGIAIIKTQ